MQVSRIALALTLVSFVACQPPGPAELSEEDIAAIEASAQAWLDAVRASDWPAVAAMYTDDAVFMPPNEPAVVGRDSILAWFEAFPPIGDVDIEVVEIDGRGELVYVRGTYELTITPEGLGPIADSGKWLEIRRKQADGSWPLSRDIFNSDLALPE